MDVHLVDGTFELFRHHHSPRNDDPDRGAVRGVLRSMVWLMERGGPAEGQSVTHLGVATDHVVESFRNALWPAYKSSEGMEANLLAQFEPLEDALEALGLAVWAMTEHEADDALAAAAAIADADERVGQVVIATPDKDLGQSVRGTRVVQWDRMRGNVRDEDGVFEKLGVLPASVPDWLALVGDTADGFPGLPGFGAKTAATLLNRFGHLESIPDDPAEWGKGVRGAERLGDTLREQRAEATLFKQLATLDVDADLSGGGATVDDWAWAGPTTDFESVCDTYGCEDLPERVERLLAGEDEPAATPELPL